MRVDYDDGSYTSMTYDAVGRLTYVYDSERGQISYVYSGNGCAGGCAGGLADRVIKEITPLGVISYTYDTIGLRTSMTVAGQEPVYYNYDANGRLVEIRQGDKVFSIGYDAVGRRTALTMPNGVKTNYAYDDGSNLLNMEHLNPLNEILEKISYVYDVNSNRISMDRSSSFSGLTGESIIKLPDPMTAVYNEANRMMTYNDEILEYDANGNLIQKGDAVYTWDVRNQLVGIDSPTYKASFKYDALGRRIEKTVNGKTTQYLYDGLDIIQEIENGMVTANYIRTLNIDEPLARIKSDGTIRYYQQDALGSVVALTDEAGTIKTQYVYDPYGNTEMIGEPSDNPFQYTGRENDGTGLYYYRSRYYSPILQRFISEDPIGMAGGINKYVYVGNRPTVVIDPFGLYWEYSQSSGQLTYVDDQTGARTSIGRGYSGRGTGLNNPAVQGVQNVGPIPQGTYTIGPQQTNVTAIGLRLPGSMRLTPQKGTNTFGRSGFLIHGGNFSTRGSSKGCVIMPLDIRNQIGSSADTNFRVVQ